MTSSLAQQSLRHAQRITSIDALRGFVMIVMLLDHVRETFFLHLQVSDPMAVPGTQPELFFSRLAAHLCAPVFVFLTGLSAWLYAHPPQGAQRDVRSFLLKRGLFLIALELTLVNFAWSGRYEVLYLQVMWAIGLSMLALALMIALPRGVLLALGLLIVAGHNALAGVHVAPDSPWHGLWTVLLQRGWLAEAGIVRVRLSYPVLPWIGVILLGWCFAPVFAASVAAARRRALLLTTGAACLALLVLLRGLNLYGENAPWQPGTTALQTAMSWLNFTKYPPSLDFLLLTLGTGLLLLAALERADNAFTRVFTTFGGAPMFYYVLHLYVLLLGYRAALRLWGPNQGTRFGVAADQFWLIWVVWLAMLPLLYVPVRAFGRFKRRSTQAWVKYF
ncbi:DUF1624 domain-containing protein [Roseateles sp. DC23W]|uniref:DUF1624 domain-containing protein n=1 Tax=Pelomonas dachongensis TaxID=3299029 RepID=A0ABW7ELI3_9BURK